MYETSHQVRCLILDAWGWCTGTTQRDGMGREVGEGSGWGTQVYLWQIHFDIWQNQYNIVKLKKKKKKRVLSSTLQSPFTVILAYHCCLFLNPHEWTLKTSYLYSSLWISLYKHVLSRSHGCTGAGKPRGAIPCWRSGRAAVRRYPSYKVRSSGCTLLEQPWRDTPRPR